MKLFDEALTFVKAEKESIEDATQDLREALRRARRNYECKYDNPIDKATGKRKIFVPLTRQEVDTIAPRFELLPEAISVKTNEPGLERKALLWEELLKFQFEKIDWRTRIKAMMAQWVNEGTSVIEMVWDEDKPDFVFHDLKDVFIFPKEPSLAEASAFAIRKRVMLSDFKNNDRYENKDEVNGEETVDDTQQNGGTGTLEYEIGRSSYKTELEYVELYERHGYFPKEFLTGEEEVEEGSDEMIDGVITVAWIDGTAKVVEISDKSQRYRFVESWYQKRPYLWYGLGVGLALRDYQFMYNKLVNRRDDNEDVLHRGMFLKRRGMNIDARQRVTGSGIWIDVDNPAEVTQLRTIDITQSSYVGENNLLGAVQRLNGTTELIRGGGSANSASEAAIRDRNAGNRLADPQAYLNRMFKLCVEAVMEMDKKFLSKSQVVKLTGRDEELAVFDDFKLKEVNKARAEEGLPPVSQEEFQVAMKKFGNERFIKFPSIKFLKGDFNVTIDSDASLIKSKAGLAQTILEGMKIAAQIPSVPETIDFADLFEKWLNLQGLKTKRRPSMMAPPGAGSASGGVSGQVSQPNPAMENSDAIKDMLTQAGAPRSEQIQ